MKTILDVFPDHEGTSFGQKKQNEFVFKFYSQPIYCPHCGEETNYWELKRKDDTSPTFCPECGKEVIHNLGFFGGNQWLTECVGGK
ncbi:MAG: zinc ribbon domain-containing protein [Bacteroidetes bacterium]|nr:zinc ribbon domain-containing protein [Bacteroidota bacterium]